MNAKERAEICKEYFDTL